MCNRRRSVPGIVCLAASPGGHLALLRAVEGAFRGCERVWVTAASSQAEALRAEGEDVRVLELWARDTRGLRGARSNLWGAWRLARTLRPALVVTSGAGHVVPFSLLARAHGARLVFVETMARVTGPSLTGRILAPFAARVVVQWPELAAAYGHPTVCRPALLEETADPAAGGGSGTFVSVGTRPEPFDRLLAAVDRAATAGVLPLPVVAQSGSTHYRPETYDTTPWMAPDEIERAIRDSRYVVCHAGSAIVSAAVASGRRPLVMPRSPARGEHRTDHQRQTLEKLADRGLVVPLGDEISPADVRAAEGPATGGEGYEPLPSVEEVLREEVEALGALSR